MNRRTATLATLTSAISALLATTASGQMHPEKPTYDYEKCYGVAAAGKNDCFTPKNSCAGTTERDREPQAWIYVPKGTCERIVGGALKPQ
jgi:uncharacterized membrane protein